LWAPCIVSSMIANYCFTCLISWLFVLPLDRSMTYLSFFTCYDWQKRSYRTMMFCDCWKSRFLWHSKTFVWLSIAACPRNFQPCHISRFAFSVDPGLKTLTRSISYKHRPSFVDVTCKSVLTLLPTHTWQLPVFVSVRRWRHVLTVDLVTWCCRRPGCVAGCLWGAGRRCSVSK